VRVRFFICFTWDVAISSDFPTTVLSKDTTALCAVCIDKTHCISLQGRSFLPDYAILGVLCGQFPKNVLFVVASATLLSHVLDDVQHKLWLGSNTKMVWLIKCITQCGVISPNNEAFWRNQGQGTLFNPPNLQMRRNPRKLSVSWSCYSRREKHTSYFALML